MRAVFIGAALALVLAGLSSAHEVEAPAAAFRFEPPPPGSYELPALGRVTEHELLGADGAPAPLLGIGPGELALVSFVYLSCGEACPLATVLMQRVDAMVADSPQLNRRVQLVTVSFDPERDTPEAMAGLAKHAAAQGRWRFLTAADVSGIAPVLADFGQDAMELPADEQGQVRLRHVLKLFLVDGEHRIRNVYSTGLLDPRLVVGDLLTLLPEAKPGS